VKGGVVGIAKREEKGMICPPDMGFGSVFLSGQRRLGRTVGKRLSKKKRKRKSRALGDPQDSGSLTLTLIGRNGPAY